jgi:hypothetical protein
MRKQQQGITFIGWLFLLIPLAIVAYAGIRVVPYYLNYTKVVKALEQTANQFKTEQASDPQQIRLALAGRMNIEGITRPGVNDIVIRKAGSGWELQADYEEVTPLFFNLQLLLVFDKRVATTG